ncbi:hypothetical protein BpHYR1_043516 [Brachionus plicatilis]|uniref:Uncharacterized protein n=1 Tax=Brachionus plicatilis TaxID=10195 RepID=A0A3M7RJP8_BRAPC|nr:hypothetical protein BpHYR1_043516 [Brachionus plicatilis]
MDVYLNKCKYNKTHKNIKILLPTKSFLRPRELLCKTFVSSGIRRLFRSKLYAIKTNRKKYSLNT